MEIQNCCWPDSGTWGCRVFAGGHNHGILATISWDIATIIMTIIEHGHRNIKNGDFP